MSRAATRRAFSIISPSRQRQNAFGIAAAAAEAVMNFFTNEDGSSIDT